MMYSHLYPILCGALVLATWVHPARSAAEEPIDRHALVTRHHPVVESFDRESPFSVGNGQFAFTADVTGLQSFAEEYESTIPLGTLSHWGWHSFPNPNGWTIEKYHFTDYDAAGRKVGYADIPGDVRTPEVTYLRANPHRLHLGRIGFRLIRTDGKPATPGDLRDIRQSLNLWDGVLESQFRFEGESVEVTTVCHPTLDVVAVRVKSPLLATGRLAIEVRFPYGTGDVKTADWTKPDAHHTELTQPTPSSAHFARRLDDTTYEVATTWSTGGMIQSVARHDYVITPAEGATNFEFSCHFAPARRTADSSAAEAGVPRTAVPDYVATASAAREHWNNFWSTGGAIDLSRSRDPRWRELERRIVLSQYLTAIQCAGDLPPQETGLTYNSWEGKFHLEMHWWHGVHFAFWDRWPLFERSLDYYRRILPKAKATARRQGYTGARWPKMTGPTGDESPSTIGPFLIWQQPHPIYYAELAYRESPNQITIEKYRDVVLETTEFMLSYPIWEEARDSVPPAPRPPSWHPASRAPSVNPLLLARGRYNLGPVLQCAQERFPKTATLNPTFELAYWKAGLELARHWHGRLRVPHDERLYHVYRNLASCTIVDGKYAFAETAPDSYTNPRWNDDHPAVLGAFGMLPGHGIDQNTMGRTFLWVWDNWNWPNTWGWDYPLAAMCAARVGRPDLAVDALLLDTPKNHYRKNGHNHQRPGLTVYLPGNGGLLTAVAMMAAGWSGDPAGHAPGFPSDGSWTVRWEGLRPLP